MTVVKNTAVDKEVKQWSTERPKAAPKGEADVESWQSTQLRYLLAMSTGGLPMSGNAQEVVEDYLQKAEELKKIRAAREKYSLQQQMTNIQIENDNFIKDSVTGK